MKRQKTTPDLLLNLFHSGSLKALALIRTEKLFLIRQPKTEQRDKRLALLDDSYSKFLELAKQEHLSEIDAGVLCPGRECPTCGSYLVHPAGPPK